MSWNLASILQAHSPIFSTFPVLSPYLVSLFVSENALVSELMQFPRHSWWTPRWSQVWTY